VIKKLKGDKVSRKINKKGVFSLFLITLLFLSMTGIASIAAKKGPYVDEVEIVARISRETAIGEVGIGDFDMFLFHAGGDFYDGLPANIRDGMYLISNTGSYDNLFLNSVTGDDGTPVVEYEGIEWFNVTGDSEIRFAFHFLMNRQYMCDYIFGGYAIPMYSPVMECEPAAPEFQAIYKDFGLTPGGDEQKAISMITGRMEYWAGQLGGRLKKVGDWWQFDGEPVTFECMMRIEDERHEIGLYTCDQVEKCGIKAVRNEWERSKCFAHTWFADPRTSTPHWNCYTGGWLSMSAYKFPEGSIAQMFAPWYGYMPGLQVEGWWQYTHDELDTVTKKTVNGQCANEQDYWDTNRAGVKLGLEESVRVFLLTEVSYYPVNKRVSGIAYDVGSGLGSRWTFLTAQVPDNKLKAQQFSSVGALFMSAVNPIDGITDVYSNYIWRPIRDYGLWYHPGEGVPIECRTPFNVEKKFHFEGADLVGELDVPSDCVVYDSAANEWVTVGSGKKAVTKVTYDYLWSNWHNGMPVDMNELKYYIAHFYEWGTKDADDDKEYNSNYGSTAIETIKLIKGFKFVDEDTIEVYGDFQHPADDAVAADYFSFWPFLPWPIWEAMDYLVTIHGPRSGLLYDYSDVEDLEQVDILVPICVEDMKLALQKMWQQGYVPTTIDMTSEEAKAHIQACIDWIDAHEHAIISNGPFYLDVYDPANMYCKLTAFRDPTYPFEPEYWTERLTLARSVIDAVDVPASVKVGDDIPVKVKVTNKIEYPDAREESAEVAYVDVYFKDAADNVIYHGMAAMKTAGNFEITIPGSKTANLSAGAYTVDVKAAYKEGGYQDVRKTQVILSKVTEETPAPTTAAPTEAPTEAPGEGMSTTTILGIVVVIIIIVALVYFFTKKK
jgi:peptide/nickel transport system substrate-binding protein